MGICGTLRNRDGGVCAASLWKGLWLAPLRGIKERRGDVLNNISPEMTLCTADMRGGYP